MNALLQPVHALEAQFEAMSSDWLDAVVRLEQSAYGHPWTHGNFSDSISAGYTAQMLVGGKAEILQGRLVGQLLGYFVAMKGVDEAHLLNITVAPDHQHQGWARVMLDALSIWARGEGAQWLWLEVRVSNARARMVYERYGFREVGLRRGYYPAGSDRISRREDAIVMSFAL